MLHSVLQGSGPQVMHCVSLAVVRVSTSYQDLVPFIYAYAIVVDIA